MNSEEEMRLVSETFDTILSDLITDKCKQEMVSFLPQFSRELVREAIEQGKL